MENLKYTVIDHPLVQHKLSLMRDVNTGSKEFRELVSETSMLMCYEAMRDLPLKEVDIQTPLGIAACYLSANFLGNHGIIAACAVHAAHFLYFNAFFLEIFNNLLLQSEAGVIASNSYHYYHSFRDITAEQICALQ